MLNEFKTRADEKVFIKWSIPPSLLRESNDSHIEERDFNRKELQENISDKRKKVNLAESQEDSSDKLNSKEIFPLKQISNLMDDLGDKNNTSEIRSECQPVKLRDDILSKHHCPISCRRRLKDFSADGY
ncbi:unnamed protein product [Heterobilharzia americana]|nr:unnamed protein product [Heterobilharzia americana]